MPASAAFECRYGCTEVIIYSEEQRCYIEQASRKKHVCSMNPQSYVKVLKYFGDQPCGFCRLREDRAAVYYRAKLPDGRIDPASSMTVICRSCSKKVFYLLQSEYAA